MKIFRHGDIPLYETKEEGEELIKHNGKFVLAEGETTGHKHVISVSNIEDMEVRKTADGGYILTLKSVGTLTHEEHKTLEIPIGKYYVGKEREVDHFQQSLVRRVID